MATFMNFQEPHDDDRSQKRSELRHNASSTVQVKPPHA